MIVTDAKTMSDRIYKDVTDYFDEYYKPVKYRFISSSYGKTANRLGIDLRELIMSDERLIVKRGDSFALYLIPLDGFNMLFSELDEETRGLNMAKYFENNIK